MSTVLPSSDLKQPALTAVGLTGASDSFSRGISAARVQPRAGRVSLAACDLALAAAAGTLLLGFAFPKFCTLVQIAMIVGFILQGSVAWVPAIVVLLLNPTDFKAGGMELQYEKFEGVTVYLFGFPLTASYAIVGATLVRGCLNLIGSRFATAAFHVGWMFPLAIASCISLYVSLLALDERVPGWSAAARVSLLLFAIWYAAPFARNWSQTSGVFLRRLGPLCCILTASAFFSPMGATIGTFYLPFVAAWSTWLTFGKLPVDFRSWRPIGIIALLLCWVVPIGGVRISAEVADASYLKMGQQTYTLMTLAMVGTSMLLVLVHRFLVQPRKTVVPTVIAVTTFGLCLAIPFVIPAITTEADISAKTNAGSLGNRLVYKLLVERAAIWRGAVEGLKEPPYFFPSPGRKGSLITNSQKRIEFRHSSHNLVLEILRRQGVLAGPIILLVIYVCCAACVRAYMTSWDPTVVIVATTFIVGVMLNGIAVGHFLETGVELLLLIAAGLCLGWFVYARTPLVQTGYTHAVGE